MTGDTDAGYVALVLHAHLPFVRHPEREFFLEEDWLYEAVTETYLPLLAVFERLLEEDVPFRITMSVSPTLASMLEDALLQTRYLRHIDRLIELSEKEIVRTSSLPEFRDTARMYNTRLVEARTAFTGLYGCNVLNGLNVMREAGNLEIVTCAATHAFLPLMHVNPNAVRAQIAMGARTHERIFGVRPRGLWLPECGFWPGHDAFMQGEGIEYSFLDAHGVLFGEPRPRAGIFAPIRAKSGMAFFGRDTESSRQVWSADEGYPGDWNYREFYRDLGFDAEYEYIKPYLDPFGARKNTGFKYHRITSRQTPMNEKAPYEPERARAKAWDHAGNFLFNRERQVEYWHRRLDRPILVLCPYDAELFGHWWYEGPEFLYAFMKKAADSRVLRLTTPGEYIDMYDDLQEVEPAYSSWGDRGYAGVWLDGKNAWIYRHLHEIADRMTWLADDFPEARGLYRDAINQAAREVLLAQSSDWAFIMNAGTTVDYAVRRTKDHVGRFLKLDEDIRKNTVDPEWLAELSARDNLFPDIDYRLWGSRK